MDFLEKENDSPRVSTVYFFGEILIERIQDLSYRLESAKSNKVDLHFTSPGGCIDAMESLIHLINNHDKDIRIILVGEAASAGFLFLCECNRPIIVKKNASGLIHYGDAGISVRDLRDEHSSSSFTVNSMEGINLEMLKWAMEFGVSDEDLERIDKGGDYRVSNELMQEWFGSPEESPKKTKEQIEEEFIARITKSILDGLDKR